MVFRNGTSILAVDVDTNSGQLGTTEALFTVPMVVTDRSYLGYDVTADGERFVTVTRPPERAPRRVVVITNFFDELRRLVPGRGRD